MLVIIKEPKQEPTVHPNVISTSDLPDWSDDALVAIITGHGGLWFAPTGAQKRRESL